MKKHLLSIFALLACFFVGYAQSETQTVTVDLLNNDFSFERGSSTNQNVPYIDAGTAIEVDPVTVTLAATDGATNAFSLWDDGLRVYKNKGANLVVAVPQGKAITSIRLVTSGTWGLPEGAEGTWNGGSKEWTGEAQSVTLNFTATGTKHVSKIIVTYKETAAAAAPGDGTKEHPYSIAEAVAAGVSGTLESDVWICGYIVGYTKGAFFAPGPQFTADGAPEYRILLSDNPEETAIKGCLDVLNFNMTDYTGDEKKAKEAELCLKRNPSNLGKKVAIKVYAFQTTAMNNYYTTQGIHNFYFMDEQGGGEDPEPSTGFTSGTYRVRNVANRGYLTYTVGANTETTQTPVDCIITSTDGVFNIYFGEPSKRYLYCGTNGKFSGNLSPNSIKIYEVDSQTDQTTTAHFVTELQLGKQYILTGEKSGMTYALSYETTGTGEEQRMLSTPVAISGETATFAPGNKYFWEFVDPNAVETYSLTINANGCEYALVGEDGDVDLNAIPAGSTLIFGISSIPEGKTLTAVKLNGTALEGESTYEFTINQNSTLDVELANAPAPEVTGKSILVPAAELANYRDHYSFRFDDAPLGSHTNGTNTADTDLRTRSFTYSAWVNVKDLGARNVVMGNIQTKYADATGAFTVKLEDGKLTLNGRSATSLTAFENAQGTPSTDEGTALDEWVFVSVVADQAAKKVTLYKNAQPISSFDTDYGVGLLHDQAQFHIADAGSSVAISEVQLWNKALTLDELKNSYNLEYTETPEGLVAYFKAGELVEGSTTELRNLGTEATTTASILKGTYNLVQWDPFFKNPVAQDLEVLDETHAHKTVTVTLEQPAKEGNSFTVTGKKGRQITDSATLYELLTVVPELAEGETLEGVLVTDAAGETVYTLDQMPIYANSDMTIALRLASDPEVPTYLVKADVTLGYATVSVDDEAAVNLPAEGLEVKEGRKVVVTLVPESATYQLESFKVNGEDATEALAGYNYTIDAIAAECSIEAVFATPKHHLTISQNGVKGESFYGEFRNNLNVRLEYDDAEGAYVEPGTTVLFVLITPTAGNYELKGVTDNGNPVDLMEFNGDKAILLSRVSEDHDFVITQDQKVGLIAVGEDGSALTYADGELKVAADAAVIEVVDMNGRLVARANDVTLSVAELAQGVYVAKATTAEGTYTLKFVKF